MHMLSHISNNLFVFNGSILTHNRQPTIDLKNSRMFTLGQLIWNCFKLPLGRRFYIVSCHFIQHTIHTHIFDQTNLINKSITLKIPCLCFELWKNFFFRSSTITQKVSLAIWNEKLRSILKLVLWLTEYRLLFSWQKMLNFLRIWHMTYVINIDSFDLLDRAIGDWTTFQE